MTRIAIDGIREGISRCANDLETLAGHEDLAYHDHRARLATALKPSVVDLVPAVLRAEHAEWRTADRQAIYQAAEAKANELVHLWIEHVKDRGLLEPPPLARELYPRAPYLSPTDFLPAEQRTQSGRRSTPIHAKSCGSCAGPVTSALLIPTVRCPPSRSLRGTFSRFWRMRYRRTYPDTPGEICRVDTPCTGEESRQQHGEIANRWPSAKY